MPDQEQNATHITKGAGAGRARPDRIDRFAPLAVFALLVAVGFIIYSSALHGPFVIDDRLYILENPKIIDLVNFLDTTGSRYLVHLSFALNHALGGFDTFGYHLVNLFIHIMNAFLVWNMVRLTFETPLMKPGAAPGAAPGASGFIALGSALIFISHPVQTQAVSYITQRFTSLAVLFYLLSITFYIRARLSGRGGGYGAYYWLSLLTAVLSMKAKEISFTLPLVIILYELVFFGPCQPGQPDQGDAKCSFQKGSLRRLLYFLPFLLTLLIIPLELFGPGLGPEKPTGDVIEMIRQAQIEDTLLVSPLTYLLTELRVIITYFRLLVLPAGQHMLYDYPSYDNLFNAEVFLSLLFIISVIGFALYLFFCSRRGRAGPALLASFGIFWFFITLSVESSVIPIQHVIFEHRLYLPSAGLVVSFACLLYTAFNALGARYANTLLSARMHYFVLIALVAGLATATYNRNHVWADDLSFYRDEATKSPNLDRVHLNLGSAYADRGMFEEAIEQIGRVLELKPGSVLAYDNLANIYVEQERFIEAEELYLRAQRMRPDFTAAYINLGTLYSTQGRSREATRQYEKAVAISPGDIDSRRALVDLYLEAGRYEDAAREYQELAGLLPEDAYVRFRLGGLYIKLGRTGDATRQYKEALDLDPVFVGARNDLANAYVEAGRYAEAEAEYIEALRIAPEFADAHFNLGQLYMTRGFISRAIKYYKQAALLSPENAKYHNNLAVAYGATGETGLAVIYYLKAIKKMPGLVEARYNLALAYIELGLEKDAARELEEVVRLDPDDSVALELLKSLED